MLDGLRPIAWVRSAIEVPSNPRSQKSSIAASSAASLSKLIGRPVFPFLVFMLLLSTPILEPKIVSPMRLPFGEILRESLTIGGWVSMWRPLEVFLYDWWPVRNEARLSDRLTAMPVRIRYANANGPDAWRADWPVITTTGERSKIERPPDTLNQATQ